MLWGSLVSGDSPSGIPNGALDGSFSGMKRSGLDIEMVGLYFHFLLCADGWMQVSTLGWKLAVGWKPAGDSGKYSAPTPDIVAVLLSAFGWKPVDTCSSAKVEELGEPKPTMMSSKSVMAMVLRMDR